MRHPAREDVPSPSNCWERSRNVSWNQRFHKLRSHRGLVGPRERDASPSGDVERRDLGGAYVAVFAMCAVEGPLVEARTHRKRRDQCTTRPCSPMEDVRRLKSKFAKRTWNVSWNQQLHFWRLTSPCRLGAQGMVAASGSEGVRRRRRPQGREWVAHTWRCLPCVRQRGRLVDSRTHRRRRDVCATQRLALGEGAG